MPRWVVCSVVVFAGACSFTPPGTSPDNNAGDGGTIDVPHDTSTIPPIDAQQCFGPHLGLDFCLAVEPKTPLALATNTAPFDTASPACDPNFTPACVLAGTSVSIDAMTTFAVKGARPLVIVSQSTMTIAGTLDVSSHRDRGPGGDGAVNGPGSGMAGCNAGTAPTGNTGGPGGSFGIKGGNGGLGNGGGSGGGAAGEKLTVTTFRGGCPGLDGGGSGIRHGNGGGAVYLIAIDGISVTGTIDASGAGTDDTPVQKKGGAGGGSGGLIVFDTPSLTVDAAAKIFANGGGGAEGSDNQIGKHGDDAPDVTHGGPGGTAQTTDGGDGGNGGNAANMGASGGIGSNQAGGGGGGGGVGIIFLYGGATVASGLPISPTPVAGP